MRKLYSFTLLILSSCSHQPSMEEMADMPFEEVMEIRISKDDSETNADTEEN